MRSAARPTERRERSLKEFERLDLDAPGWIVPRRAA